MKLIFSVILVPTYPYWFTELILTYPYWFIELIPTYPYWFTELIPTYPYWFTESVPTGSLNRYIIKLDLLIISQI